MELKPQKARTNAGTIKLLIVPYGIETQKTGNTAYCDIDLLIVPYGIETTSSRNVRRRNI